MKILAVTGNSDKPEAALFYGLKERGHEVCVLSGCDRQQQDQFRSHGIDCESFTAKSRMDIKATKVLRHKIKSWKPDIVHAFSGRTLAAAVRCKRPQSDFGLVTYRGTIGHLSHFDPGTKFSFLSPKVDAISCVSKAVQTYLVSKGVPEQKLATIYKGHDPAWYNGTAALSKSAFELPDGCFVSICVANARPVKGVDIFIKAANRLQQYKDLYFLIVGDIKDENLKSMAFNPRIKFLGFRSDAQAIVRMADCLVVPSRGREGLPKALLEALAQTKVVIASKVGGIPEVIQHEAEGLLIPSNDSAILARAIIFLASNPQIRNTFAQAGYQKIISRFGVKQMVDQTLELYSRVLT